MQPLGSSIRTGLESSGLSIADTAAVIDRLAGGASLADVSCEIAQGKLLRKRSASGRRHVLAALRRRFVRAPADLPAIGALSRALHRFPTPTARGQVLLPYLFAGEPAALELATSLVLPRLEPGSRLAKAEVVEALKRLLAARRQRAWSPALQRRWAEGFLSVLRDVGALGRGARREQLLAYAVRPEAFAFHLWGSYEHGLRGSALHESLFWQRLLLRPPDARRLVGVVADRGWWKYTSAGGAEEIVPVHGSLMEWLDVAVG